MPFKNIGIFAAARGAAVVTPTPTPTATFTPTPTPSAVPAPTYTDGYTMGGLNPGNTPAEFSAIERFPFSSPFTTSTSIGDLTSERIGNSGNASDTDGYSSGGTGGDSIESFPFASPFTTATDVGNLFDAVRQFASTDSDTDGYQMGGIISPSNPINTTLIQSFPFASPFTTGTSQGNLAQEVARSAGNHSSTDGYNSYGQDVGPGVYEQDTERFPFSSPFTTATDVGNLSNQLQFVNSSNSSTDGYTLGGSTEPGFVATNFISSFPFASPFTIETDVGDLTVDKFQGASSGISGDDDGFMAGGSEPAVSPTITSSVDSFPFSSPFTNATDVGDLSDGRRLGAGTQGQ